MIFSGSVSYRMTSQDLYNPTSGLTFQQYKLPMKSFTDWNSIISWYVPCSTVFKQNLFSVVTNSNTLVFLNSWWALVVCIRLLGSAYGQRQVASHANEKGPGNWSLCCSDTCHACSVHSAVVLCVDHMSKVGHVTTLLQFWFPKTQHCWNGLVTLVSYGISLAALFILLTWLLLRERYNVTVNIASSFFTACFSKSSVWPSGLSQYEDVTLVSQKYRKFRVSVESLQE